MRPFALYKIGSWILDFPSTFSLSSRICCRVSLLLSSFYLIVGIFFLIGVVVFPLQWTVKCWGKKKKRAVQRDKREREMTLLTFSLDELHHDEDDGRAGDTAAAGRKFKSSQVK